MIIKGSIYLTSDYNMVANSINSHKIINVTENGIFLDHPNSVAATIMLPPIDALMADTDNDMVTLKTIYWNYLLSDEPTKFMALICTVLNKGVNIFMYIPQEEINEFSYVGILLEYIKNIYGIYIGTPQTQFMFDAVNYTQYIADLLFNNDLLDVDEYLKYSNIQIAPIESIVKLDQCLNPYIINKTIDSIREYFSKGVSPIHILTEDEKYDIIRNYKDTRIHI